jgi:hypothetical protein
MTKKNDRDWVAWKQAVDGWIDAQAVVLEMAAARNEAVARLGDLENLYIASGERETALQEYAKDLEYRLLRLSELHATKPDDRTCVRCNQVAPCHTMKIVIGQ